jgi:hypothetical protein
MNERDDIFDEIIGADTDEREGDEPEGADDDADVLDVRTALLTKHEMLALISLKTTTRGSVIVRYDPRQSLPVAKAYEDTTEAAQWFRRSLNTSLRNGWHVIYDGAPLAG